MSTFVNNDVTPNSVIFASDHNTQGALLAAILNGGIENDNISSSAAIARSKLATSASSSWTPTWTNASVGNGTVDAKYYQENKFMFFRVVFTLGSTSTIGTAPTFTLPVTTVSPAVSNAFIGVAQLIDTGVATVLGAAVHNSTTLGAAVAFDANSTYVRLTAITSTVPLTWGTGDVYYAEGKVEVA